MNREEVQIILQDNLPDAEVVVHSADDTHFAATIISDAFVNKKSLDRQKIIYAIIGHHITNGAIHALSLKTFTRQEWQEKCGN